LAGPQIGFGSGGEERGKIPSEKWNPVIHPTANLVIKGFLPAYSVAINVKILI